MFGSIRSTMRVSGQEQFVAYVFVNDSVVPFIYKVVLKQYSNTLDIAHFSFY